MKDVYDIRVKRVITHYLKEQHTTSNVCQVTITIVPYSIIYKL